MRSNSVRTAIVIVATAGLAPCIAQADINGFGDFSGFSINQGDSASAPALAPGSIRITSNTTGQARSIFYNTRQGISQFSASFTYRMAGTPTSSFGLCFVVQNSNDDVLAVADPSISGISTKFGYSDFGGTFNRSNAISLEHGTLSTGSSSTAFYADGSVGGGSSNTAPLNFSSNNPINVNIAYNGTTIHSTFLDTVTGASFETLFAANIPLEINAPTAFIGFTASSNSNANTEQYISNFQFSNVPAPGMVSLLGACGLLAARRRRGR